MADPSKSYNQTARLFPVIIVMIPIVLMAIVYLAAYEKYIHYLTSALLIGSITYLMRQLGRDQGKAKEPLLFELWGGAPTTLLLSHEDTTIDELTKRRYHKKLQKALPDLRIPTREEEQKDQANAYNVYKSCTAYLRNKSRDTKKYNLVFDELTSYGFRRNLWGLKSVAVIVLTLSIVINFLVLGYLFMEGQALPMYILVLNSILFVLLIVWILVIKPSWVKIPADAYAQRLLETLDE